MKLYSIRSKSSKLFDTPFPCENDARVIYELRYLLNSEKKSIISAIPDDHQLHCVGIFDPETGKIEPQNDCIITDLSVLVRKVSEDVVSNGV